MDDDVSRLDGKHNRDNHENEEHHNGTLADDAADPAGLRGDAIGDTVYSERFVLNTLLKLRDDWNEELEEDLCQLWDMTEDPDVVNYLIGKQFIPLALDVVKSTDEHRLVEILVGIIGNLCCSEEACKSVYSTENSQILLSLMSVTDTPLLIQLMRLYKAMLYNLRSELNSFFTDDVLSSIIFFLRNSKNKDLLLFSMQVVAQIIDRDDTIVSRIDFLTAANEAFLQIFIDNEDDYLSHDDEKYISAYLSVVQNLSLSENKNTADINCNTCLSIFNKILCLCENIVDETKLEMLEFLLFTIGHFLNSFKLPYDEKVLLKMLEILSTVLERNLELDESTLEQIKSTYNYMIKSCSKSELNKLQHILQDWPEEKYTTVFENCILAKSSSDT